MRCGTERGRGSETHRVIRCHLQRLPAGPLCDPYGFRAVPPNRIERFRHRRVSNPVMVDERIGNPAVVVPAGAAARAVAFEQFAEDHLPDAYRLASAILGSRNEAEDAVHDAFLAAWRNWHSLRNPHAMSRWFDAIVVNTCRNMLRRRRPGTPEASIVEIPQPSGADGIGSIAERDALEEALASLNPDQRIVVALRFYRDYTIDDIAARTGAPVGTVKSRLHHALQKLERQLQAAEGKVQP
jgi:RNA polymerase sigma-70 factor, ECF subfamily